MGTCQGLYNDIIYNCNATISAGFNTTISTVCSGGTNTGDRCRTAGEAIGNACFASVQLGNNATCTGACGGQLATAAAACATSSDVDFQAAITSYNELCGFEVQCTVATNAFDAVSTCEDALQSNDLGTLCSASCRSLLQSVQASCPNFAGITRDALNEACAGSGGSEESGGSEGSGSEVLQASGIITLLLVAIFAFIV